MEDKKFKIIRITLTAVLIIGVFWESGFFTGMSIFLIAVALELIAYTKSKRGF